MVGGVWLAAMGSPAAAHGEEPAPKAAGDVVVITGTRTPERAQRSAVRTDVLGRDEAIRRGALTVGDALATQPGLNVTRDGSLGGAASLQMQGFDRERVLLLEDGERVVGDGFEGGDVEAGAPVDLGLALAAAPDQVRLETDERVAAADRPALDRFQQEAVGAAVGQLEHRRNRRLQVGDQRRPDDLRPSGGIGGGPQSLLQGRNSIAGTLAIKTRDPSWQPEGGVRLVGGDYHRREAGVYVSAPFSGDQVAFRLAADEQDRNSWLDFAPFARVSCASLRNRCHN